MTKIFQGLLKNITAYRRRYINTFRTDRHFGFAHVHPRSIHWKYFRQTLFLLLANALIPVFIICVIISVLMMQNLRQTADDNNYNLLAQFQSNVENIINEVNYVNIGISVNSELYYTLQKAMTHQEFDSVSSNPNSVVNPYLIPLIASTSYIDSMYIYIDNDFGRFISVPEGLCFLTRYPDTSWLDGYEREKEKDVNIWCIPRSYQKYNFLNETTEVISIYQKLYYHEGVSIINLSRDYFVNELNALSLEPGQLILAVNDNAEILFHNDNASSFPLDLLLQELTENTSEILPDYVFQKCHYYVVQLYFWINKKCKIAVIGISTAYLFGLGMYAHFRTFVWHDTDFLKKEIRELLMQRPNYNSEFNNLFINH